MYIGSTGPRGLHHLVYEVVDNSVDEALAGYCTSIDVTIHADNSITVVDNGRGIPVDIMRQVQEAGRRGRADHAARRRQVRRRRLQGLRRPARRRRLGASTRCPSGSRSRSSATATIWTPALRARQARQRARVMEKLGKDAQTGTTVTFMARSGRSSRTVDYDFDTLAHRLRETAFLNKDLGSRSPTSATSGESDEFQYEGGIVDFVELPQREQGADPPQHRSTSRTRRDDGAVEVAHAVEHGYNETIFTFANNINTTEGGTHLDRLQVRADADDQRLRAQKDILKEKDENLSGEDMREGLTAVITVKLHDPQFEGQTKTKLGNTEIEARRSRSSTRSWPSYLEENPAGAADHREGGQRGPGARSGAQGARAHAPQGRCSRRSSCPASWPTARSGPGALRDLPGRGRLGRRLGQAGAATARSRRSCRCAARSSTCEKARIDKMLANEEIRTMITAMGTGIGEEFDLDKARYHKIIIMTDADVDGAHIRTLLLTFFFRYMRAADRAAATSTSPSRRCTRLKQGKKHSYIYNDAAAARRSCLRGTNSSSYKGRRDEPRASASAETKIPALPASSSAENEGCGQEASRPQWGGEPAVLHWLKNVRFLDRGREHRRRHLEATCGEDIDEARRRSPPWEQVDDEQTERPRRAPCERRRAWPRSASGRGTWRAASSRRSGVGDARTGDRSAAAVTLHLGERKAEAASCEELRRQIVELIKGGPAAAALQGLGGMNPDQLGDDDDEPRDAAR